MAQEKLRRVTAETEIAESVAARRMTAAGEKSADEVVRLASSAAADPGAESLCGAVLVVQSRKMPGCMCVLQDSG